MKQNRRIQWGFAIALFLALLATYGIVTLIDWAIASIRK